MCKDRGNGNLVHFQGFQEKKVMWFLLQFRLCIQSECRHVMNFLKGNKGHSGKTFPGVSWTTFPERLYWQLANLLIKSATAWVFLYKGRS